MVEALYNSNFLVTAILPFILVFTVVFAVLQKSKILGDGKKQIDALVALAVGLIVVAFGVYTKVIVQMSAFLGVAIVIILVFMLLTGIFYEPGKFELNKNVKYVGMGLAAIAVAVTVLVYTDSWQTIVDVFKGGGNGWAANIVFVVIIIAAVGALVWGGSGDKKPADK